MTGEEVENVVGKMRQLNKTDEVNGKISIIAVDSL